jgi:hypothetical protein
VTLSRLTSANWHVSRGASNFIEKGIAAVAVAAAGGAGAWV